MKRPPKTVPVLDGASRNALAARAIYTGSPEHKTERSWLGMPQPRKNSKTGVPGFKQIATICPLVQDKQREIAIAWVKNAISQGHYNPNIWDGEFPREIWHKDDQGNYWFGRLTQRGTGDGTQAEYKGWPISREEWRENFA